MNYSDLEKENQALRSEVSSLKQIMSVSNRTIYIEKYNELVNKYNNLLLNYKSVKESLSRYEANEKVGVVSNYDKESGPNYTHLNTQPSLGYSELRINRVVKSMCDISTSEFRSYLIDNGFSEKHYVTSSSDYSFHRWGKTALVQRAVMNDRSVNGKGIISKSAQKKFGVNIDFSKYNHVIHKNGDIKVNDLTVSDFTDIVRLYVLS
jgi:hypothetical protein